MAEVTGSRLLGSPQHSASGQALPALCGPTPGTVASCAADSAGGRRPPSPGEYLPLYPSRGTRLLWSLDSP